MLATPQGPLVISPSFYAEPAFDPSQFVPVTIMAKLPYILVVHPKVPVATFAEFIAYAKANPGKLNYGTPGLGSSSHLTGEMLKLASHIEMTHVPYAGLAPALTDLLAGHTDVMTANLDSVLRAGAGGQAQGPRRYQRKARAGAARAAGDRRDLSRGGVDELVRRGAPPKTPPEIAAKLSRAFAEILREPEVEKKWREMTLTPVGGTPEEVGAFLKAETARWRKVIVSGGIKRQ